MTNKSLSEQICEICGIKPKLNCINCPHPCETACNNCSYSDLNYPDFEQPENFVKLYEIINKQSRTEILNRLVRRLRVEAGWYTDELKHKTQECEELKKQLETSEKWRIKAESLNENFELKNTCYRKALEEIEKVINNILNSCLGRNTVSCRPAHNVCGDLINILDIINKAKDGKNEYTTNK